MRPSNFSADSFLSKSLQKRKEQNALRKLLVYSELIDFCSNDYLGFARSEKLSKNISKACAKLKPTNGSGGSRLLAGNTIFAENLEKYIAKFHNAEGGLIYNSGYDANVGLFSAIGQKGNTIIYDELIHASVHDGMKMSAATTYAFRHNDLKHLEERLKIAEGIIYVAVESVYSMDGDYALLKEISVLCKKHKANLIVDEAHATGITMNGGKGRVQELKLEKEIFARVHTFGKGLGCHGAAVFGSSLLRDYLINFSRAFIYTTALPVKSLVAIYEAYELLQKSKTEIKKLHKNIEAFKSSLSKKANSFLIESCSPIQCMVIGGNDATKKLAEQLQNKGFDVRPILNPTVAKGKERLRICIHSYNTGKEIKRLSLSMNGAFEKKNA
ncbi:pyridoxal phosphate-dependent aminotransferase family protein [soil metagenome]